ncbi:MAG: FtsB family cell division protein, partial [Elioraea tepidiphila]
MSIAAELKRRAFAAVPPVLGLALVGFFAWHTLHGSRGLIALGAIQEQIALAETELARLEAELNGLLDRVRTAERLPFRDLTEALLAE